MRSITLHTSVAAAGCLAIAAAIGTLSAPASHAAAMLPEPAPVVDRQALSQAANVALNLAASDVVPLAIGFAPGEPGVVAVPLAGEVYELDVRPQSVRTEGFILRSQQADGSWLDHDPGPVRTFTGEVVGVDGATVAGSLLDDGLHATVLMADGSRWWVQPAFGVVPGAAMNDHVVYHGADVLEGAGACGVTDAWLAEKQPGYEIPDGEPMDGGVAGGAFFCAELGADADREFYVSYGSSVPNVQNRIELVINTMNNQYESQVAIVHLISAILVRTSEPDPYSSTDAGTLLNQFTNEWNNNQGSIQRDIAQLFTGKNLNGGTIGIAWLGVVCTNLGYSVVESDCCGSLACATDLSAHELGHNWAAGHCDPCNETMRSFIGCFNNFLSSSINSIINHRNSRGCLDMCDGSEVGVTTLPFFDDFPSSVIDPNLWTGIDGAVSNTEGIGEPSGSFSLNLDGNDVIRSAIMDLSTAVQVTLSYWYERTGPGNSPENGEDLVFEYRTDDFQWGFLSSQPGSGPDMTAYEFVSVDVPSAAFHDGFRLRIRNLSSNANSDDWYVDDVSVDVIFAPNNDECTGGTLIFEGLTPFSNIGATTDGPDETLGGCGTMEGDVWFKYVNPCDGEVSISICDADFDTQLAVYAACPTGPDEFIACNDDACGNGSTVTFQGTASTLYRIRVGGPGGAEGIGTLDITCTPGVACPGDCGTEDGTVDIQDLLALLAQWGGAGSCDLAPAGGDGNVDIQDLLELLSGWGPCS